jgi:phosphorylcholine metabolism protein LicD
MATHKKTSRKSRRKVMSRGTLNVKSKKKAKSNKKFPIQQYIVLKQKEVNLLYDITKQTIQLLDKEHIEYWAEGGTLVGIMRSKGFIPWDDDVDIAIDTSDKHRLLQLKSKFKKIGLDLVGVGNYMKVKTPKSAKVWIDIFCLDNGTYPQKQFSAYNYKSDELYPLKYGQFGPFKMKIANKAKKYLKHSYKDWDKTAFIYNHATKQKLKVSLKDYPELKLPTLPT